MDIRFPCGAKGRAEFCPKLCQYGEFCNLAKKAQEETPVVQEEEPVEEIKEEDLPEVEFYY